MKPSSAQHMHRPRAKMTRDARLEIYALLQKARLQLNEAQKIHRKLEDLFARLEKGAGDAPPAKTKRKIPK
jgi:hypothetical protein